MPRLLSINNYHYRRGGSDVVYLDHAALMEQQGWSNAFFSMHHPQNMPTVWSDYFVSEIEYGHSYSPLQKLTMASKVIYSYEAQRQLSRLLDNYPADIAHLHCIYHHLSPSILSTLKRAGVPIVLTAHDLKIACPAYKMYNAEGVCERCKGGNFTNVVTHRCVRGSIPASAVVMLESGLHRLLDSYRSNVDKIVVPSRFFMEKFVEWGWPRERFAYIPNYVEAERFTPAYDNNGYFIYFGRLVPEKGLVTLMRAAVAAGVRVKLVGTGPLDLELRTLATKLGGDIEFLGYRSGAELHAVINGALAVVLPSEWYENAPMTVLESFAMGKPVIGAAIGGIPELIYDDYTGWTFTSGSVDELASLLSRVACMSSAQLERVGRAARELVAKQFNRSVYLDAMLSLYADLGVG